MASVAERRHDPHADGNPRQFIDATRHEMYVVISHTVMDCCHDTWPRQPSTCPVLLRSLNILCDPPVNSCRRCPGT
jgi:hypothetical protein